MKNTELDLTLDPRRELGSKILSVSNELFDSVRQAPLPVRARFPTVLRNNNFALTLLLTRKYVFLEITTKLQAKKSKDVDLIEKYRRVFTSKESNLPAIFSIDNSRLCRIGGITAEGLHSVSFGSNFSMCIWDCRSKVIEKERSITSDISLLYVVGFGDRIQIEDAWQEFDTLIRVTLSDWRNA